MVAVHICQSRINTCSRLNHTDACGFVLLTLQFALHQSLTTRNALSQAISALRAKLSNAADDQNIVLNGASNLTPVDSVSITFPRTVNQVSHRRDAGCLPLSRHACKLGT